MERAGGWKSCSHQIGNSSVIISLHICSTYRASINNLFITNKQQTATVLGKKAASAKHFCLWCVADKDIVGTAMDTTPISSYHVDHEGMKNKPLFHRILPSMVMIDLLHLLLRIGEQVCCFTPQYQGRVFLFSHPLACHSRAGGRQVQKFKHLLNVQIL
jgi:hypothetical protein